MRYYTNRNVWSQVAFTQQASVQITVDDADVNTAVFDDFTTDINCNPNFCSQEVLAHEYGHYVDWSYGGNFDDECAAGVDEGNGLEETTANLFGILFIADDEETNAQYGALLGFPNAPSAHTTAGPILNFSPTCPNGALPNATDGQPLEQAVWELMFNRDCSVGTCFTTSTFASAGVGRIWIGLNQEQVLTRVGAALGFAMSVLGTNNITHNQVRAMMRARIATDADSATATRAQRLFSHHGLTCPACCVGC